jgi:hypothetical protein
MADCAIANPPFELNLALRWGIALYSVAAARALLDLAQGNLLKWINLIWAVQCPSQKYSGSLLTQITSISAAIPTHTKGRFAIVTNVGPGCDGREWRC